MGSSKMVSAAVSICLYLGFVLIFLAYIAYQLEAFRKYTLSLAVVAVFMFSLWVMIAALYYYKKGTRVLPPKTKGFFLFPTETFNSVKDEDLGSSLIHLATCLLVYAILGIIASLIPPEWFGALIPLKWAGVFGVFFVASGLLGLWAPHPVVFITYNLITMIIGILVSSLWMHIWVYIVGGRKGVDQTMKAMVYGSTPVFLLGWIPFLGRIIFGIWTLVVQIIGIRQLHEISTGRAVLAYIIGFIIPAIIVAVFVIIILRALGGPYIPP